MDSAKKEFIEFMMEAGALKFGDFVTKSGRNTPYFINTGNYTTGMQIAALGRYYAALIQETVSRPYQAMFGPAYKGIPLVAAVAVTLARDYGIDKPVFFNRKESKDHGEGGLLIGYTPQKDDNVIIVEDVITAGTAIGEAMSVLKKYEGLTVSDMFISVDRCEVGQEGSKTAVMEVQKKFGIKVHSLVTIADIRDHLVRKGGHSDIIGRMEQYMDKYCLFE